MFEASGFYRPKGLHMEINLNTYIYACLFSFNLTFRFSHKQTQTIIKTNPKSM